MPLFPVVALLFLLVGYNDLGTMLILLAIVVGVLWAAGRADAGVRQPVRDRPGRHRRADRGRVPRRIRTATTASSGC